MTGDVSSSKPKSVTKIQNVKGFGIDTHKSVTKLQNVQGFGIDTHESVTKLQNVKGFGTLTKIFYSNTIGIM